MAGFLAKKLYNIPFVLTTHSLEPLRAWKAEQLGSGYAMSSWMERTAILDADAIIAVSNGTKADILRAYPRCPPSAFTSSTTASTSNEYQQTPRTDALDQVRRRSRHALRPLRRPHHAPEGRHASGRCHALPAAGHAGRALRGRAGHAGDRRRDARQGGGAAPQLPAASSTTVQPRSPGGRACFCHRRPHGRAQRRLDREDGHQAKKPSSSTPTARVFCCPSVYEPFGIINLEAMACGAPVVASGTGGILEVVVDDEISGKTGAEPTGRLVPFEPDSVTGFPIDHDRFARDLARHLTELMSNPELSKRLGAAGRRRVEAIFGWPAIAKQTVELYRSLLNK